MPRHLRPLWGGAAGMVLLVQAVGCAGAWSGLPKPASPQPVTDTTRDTLTAVALESPAEGGALVYVFNVSGGTLVRGALSVNVDGSLVTHLPRKTYTTLGIAPGQHLWYVQGGRLELTVDAGRTYFVACAYDPWGSAFWPLEGEDAKVREIDEATARVLLQTYPFQAREEGQKIAAALAPPQPVAHATRDTVPAIGEALVYVFNSSGWTLLGSDLDVDIDGSTVHLPRKTYTTVGLAPGRHLWYVTGGELELTVEAGRTYFVACAYDPLSSQYWPLEGEDASLREVKEATARKMLRTYRFQAR